jgi:methionyl-tRNA formyltransferase
MCSSNLKQWDMKSLTGSKFDVGVLVSFGYLLRQQQFELLTEGGINMHPSLLPKVCEPLALIEGRCMTCG